MWNHSSMFGSEPSWLEALWRTAGDKTRSVRSSPARSRWEAPGQSELQTDRQEGRRQQLWAQIYTKQICQLWTTWDDEYWSQMKVLLSDLLYNRVLEAANVVRQCLPSEDGEWRHCPVILLGGQWCNAYRPINKCSTNSVEKIRYSRRHTILH